MTWQAIPAASVDDDIISQDVLDELLLQIQSDMEIMPNPKLFVDSTERKLLVSRHPEVPGYQYVGALTSRNVLRLIQQATSYN